ncbi:MAG: UDP-N-acetylglucosamine 2-epimerase (hydrolyzing) [Lachnospiraceae bacterium]|nr:UDP-N-acetylglucosamine 2-epimerase (hydrolyzing) [Lachnospiraceae bacterium]
MKKQIGVLTSTRAEFGLLKPLIQNLMKDDCFEVKVLVTGAHLSPDFGYTYKEIEEARIPIAEKIECLTDGDNPRAISENMAMALRGFGEYFQKHKLDLLIVLGDRYETMAVCIAAMNFEIPIAHIHGGEATEGLIDEAIRHSITKMSQLHFACTEMYRKRIVQMGEQPDRVFNVGALAVENILNMDYISSEELGKAIGIDLTKDYGVVTFHPVTLEKNSGVEQIREVLAALTYFRNMSFIITKANADAGGRRINEIIDDYARKYDNVIAVTSLGVRKYLSAVKGCKVVIGNSSSGIIEAPCLHVPTVNIGDRQKGRFMPDSIINCIPEEESIVKAINNALDKEFQAKVLIMTNPFGDGNTSKTITAIIHGIFEQGGDINIKKSFYDLRWD